MRKMMMAAVVGALGAAVVSATPAQAQWRGGYYGNQGYGYGYGRNNDVRREMRECRRELRRADSRWEYQRELRECRREIARARWEDRHDNWRYRDRYRDRDYYDRRYRRY
jgi:hypothetical protein